MSATQSSATPANNQKQAYAFGTSGYRSDQESAFNEAVVHQITDAIADYLIQAAENSGEFHPVLIGGDTREKSRRFIPMISQWLLDKGFDVYQAKSDVPTPVLAYAAKFFNEYDPSIKQTLGCVLMTASHNPWPYGGYNFLTPDAAVVPSSISKQFEKFQLSPLNKSVDRARFGLPEKASLKTFDPFAIYQAHLRNGLKIDYKAIKESGLELFYDPLYATGRHYFPRLLKEEGIALTVINDADERPADYKGMPEPSAEYLKDLQTLVLKGQGQLKLGFANDGDADRFGVLDEKGDFIPPGDVLVLVLHHLIKNRKQTGVVVRSQASTHLLDALALKAGLKTLQTPVGYKYIAETFIEHEEEGATTVLFGGESSGGLSIGGHIPEKDGLLANLLVAELVATEKMPISKIFERIKASVAQAFVFEELTIKTPENKAILEGFSAFRESGGQFANLPIDLAKTQAEANALKEKFGTMDGVKLYFEDGSWLLVRASGTEPLARVYIEAVASNAEEAEALRQKIHVAVEDELLSRYEVSATEIHVKI
ncbi:MAG: hypothetical protein VKJ04_01550 [Vampirovibrionales bacterium]|nr:hypothetical protein [Vampirovibrionales bacterium]